MSSLGTSSSVEIPSAQGGFAEVTRLWHTLVLRRWLILSLLGIAGIVAALITLRQQKIYSSTCTIIIDLVAPRVLDSSQVQEVVESGPGSYWYTREYYETQYKVIGSRAVAARVVERLHLATDDRFLGIDQIQNPVARAKRRIETDLVGRVLGLLHVDPVKESRMVQIRIEHPDPQRAADLANAFADSYIDEVLSVKFSATHNASQWLERQLADLEQKLEISSKELYAFKRERDIVSTTFEDKQSMVSQRLVALNDALTKARVQKAQLQARRDAIKSLRDGVDSGPRDGIPQLESQYVIQQMKLTVMQLSSECADLQKRYLERHPKLTSCQERLALAKNSLNREIESSLVALENEFAAAVLSERNLNALYAAAKEEAFKVNQYEEDYQRLKRALDNNQRLYDLVLKRLKDAGLSGLMQTSNVRVVDRARPGNTPVRPRVLLNLIFGLLLGLVAGVATAFAVDRLDTSVKTQEQLEQLGLTFLGVIPKVTEDKRGEEPAELAAHAFSKSAAAECCRSIRTNLVFMSAGQRLSTILVTSSVPQEGKTMTACSLAATLADGGNRVLLLDADLRRPRTHRVFNVSNQVGLSSVIVGTNPFEDAIKATGIAGLSVMVSGPLPPNPTELLHSDAFNALLGQLRERYDRIIIDSPPVGAVADAAVISTQVDGTLVVVKAGITSRDEGARAVRSLKNVRARILGSVLNDVDLDKKRYGYNYYYGYYYGRRKDEATS